METTTKPYAEMLVTELRRRAAGRIPNYGKMKRADLVTALTEADAKEARAAQKTKTAKVTKILKDDAKTKAATARRNGKAPADAQAATNPGLAKAEAFVAAARAAGWTAKAQLSDSNKSVAVVSARRKDGAQMTLYWLDGVWQRWDPYTSTHTPDGGKARKILNASAARKLLTA
jgi:hypothetical protein